MTTPPTTESGIPDIDADVMAMAREAYHSPFRDTLDTASVSDIIDSIARAIQAARGQAFRDGYLFGFKASGEGWNGEYPFEGNNPLEDSHWLSTLDTAKREWAAKTMEGK